MTQLERRVRTTQRRLWLNRWFECVSRSLACGAGVFAALVLVQRLYDLSWPVLWVGAGVAAVALLTSFIWLAVTREDPAFAAARLDEAAGLKERISSGRYCQGSSDPFAQAVTVDAERVSASISPRRHIRLKVPSTLWLSSGSVIVAALMFLITPGLLSDGEAEGSQNPTAEAQQARAVVKRKLDDIRKWAEETPSLEDLKEKLDGLDKHAGGKLTNPTQIRHEAVKKIDKLADAVKQKRQTGKYDSVRQVRKMLRGLKIPKSSDAPTRKLSQALSQGDFKTAREEIAKIKEQLATLKSEQDKEMTVKLSKQLSDLAKQLENLSQDKKLAQKLEQAGIKKEDIERMLENLKKKDLDQLKKQLAEKGFNQQKINEITKQLQQRQQAGSMAKNLSKAMQQGAKCQNPAQMGEAISGLSQAADQLSELESLEQEMIQLDAAITALQDAQNDLDKTCPKCGGTGMVNGRPCPGG